MTNALHFAVVVGINRYPALRHLQRARGDAEDFARWLKDPDGGALADDHVALITIPDTAISDGTPREDARPIQREVFLAIHRFRQAAVAAVASTPTDWPKTRLYFYVSGHGISPSATDAALLMADAGPDWYGENVSCLGLIEHLQIAQPFSELVFFADCCREYVATAPAGRPTWTQVHNHFGEVKVALGCATYFGDYAYEPTDEELEEADANRGYFTRALLEGLRREAAVNGRIDDQTLAGYVRARVEALTSKRKGPPQKAHISGSGIVFREGVVETRHEVTIAIPTGLVGDLVLRNGTSEIGRHDAASPSWTVLLPNQFYRITRGDGSGEGLRDGGFFEVRGEARHVQL